MIPAFPYGEDVFRALCEHLVLVYPEEGCGVILETPGRPGGGFRFVAIANARRSAHAFELDAQEHLAIERETLSAGERIASFVHSHPDGDAALSAADVAAAAPNGRPLYPGVSHLVVAVCHARVTNASLFDWVNGSFREQRARDC